MEVSERLFRIRMHVILMWILEKTVLQGIRHVLISRVEKSGVPERLIDRYGKHMLREGNTMAQEM